MTARKTGRVAHECPHCHGKDCPTRLRYRTDAEKRALGNRLARIEGQIQGLRAMLEKNAYCMDMLQVSAAATSALHAFNRVLLESHVRTCVVKDLQAGRGSTIDELLLTLQRLMR